jgi:hypothetical protein
MAPSRTIVAYLVLVFALGALALHPVPWIERGLDWLLIPSRACEELAAPVGWIQGRDVDAGDSSRRETMRRELFEHQALEDAVLDSALSPRSERHPAASRVHAEVVRRSNEARDTILVRVDDATGLERGMPVVTGDWFVGLVSGVPRKPGPGPAEISVELVTGSHARIGGAVRGADGKLTCELVVGGVAPPRGQVFLDVHEPSPRWIHEGRVEVYEPDSLGEPFTRLADGYLLGDLVLATMNDENGGVRTLACVRPGLDYEAGLYQVLVLCPQKSSRAPSAAASEDVLRDGAWAPARLFLRSEPSSWREGRKLALGWSDGVLPGAALVSGVRLVGRVEHAGPYSSNVRMVGDPGLSFVALAMVEDGGDVRPHVLGRIESLGRASDGALIYSWTAILPLAGDAARKARIWTGSGESGVPRGLLLGDTDLPAGPGTHVLRIVQPEGAVEPKGLAVRLIDSTRGFSTEGEP